MEAHVRTAKKEDMPQVLKLIKELAAFEKEPSAVAVTVGDLEREGYGPAPLFTCFVAEVEKKTVGMALVYPRFSTWKGRSLHLEDLVVTQKFRGRGIGTQLYKRAMQHARQQNANQAQWTVLNWNKNAIKMYRKSGAVFHKDWWLATLGREGIEKNSNF
ncbi:MAG: GNAT family N-acetyltransferase [Marinirhabdus sp.]